MIRYILRRLAWTVVIVWAIATLTFLAIFVSPVDAARQYAGARAPIEVVERVRHEYGLDRPPVVQYWRYVGRIATGDFGTSFSTGKPVLASTMERLPKTMLLAAAAMLVSLVLGIPLGILAAYSNRSVVDKTILGVSLVGVVMPTFVLGYLLLYVFAFRLRMFPLGGSGSFKALILPALSLGVPGAAWYARMLRSTVLNILGEDYVRMARSKGLSERAVVARHVLSNSLSPIVTMIGIDIGVLFGGVLIIEKVFGWPGIGEQAWRAISFNDIPMVMGTVIIAAIFVALFNLVADLINAALDPRLRYA